MTTHADWEWPSWSPKTYHTYEITFDLISRLRTQKWFAAGEGGQCGAANAIASANTLFRRRGGGALRSQLRPAVQV